MTPVFFDLETRSRADLPVVGGARYACNETTELLCGVWINGTRGLIWVVPEVRGASDLPASRFLPAPIGDPRLFHNPPEWSIHFGPEVPPLLLEWLDQPWAAHNCHGFDALVLESLYPSLKPRAWVDTLKLSRRGGLPGPLEGLGKALFGMGKHEGGRILHALMEPNERTGEYLPLNSKNLIPLVAYCVQDVFLIRSAFEERLNLVYRLPDDPVMAADVEINNRGIRLDLGLARTLTELEITLRQKRGEELEFLTAHLPEDQRLTRELLRSVPKFRAWLYRHFDLTLDNLRRGTITELLDSEELQDESFSLARLALEGRLGETRITTAKLQRGLEQADEHGIIRHVTAYNSAHTGRWGGRGIQPHNLPRGKLKPKMIQKALGVILDAALGLEAKATALLGLLDDDHAERRTAALSKGQPEPAPISVSDALASLVRPCILPREFHVTTGKAKNLLGIVDFSAIEARGLFWIANMEARMDDFRADLDPYKVFAARMFGIPYDQVTDDQRNLCKPPVLGCGYQLGGAKLEVYARAMGVDLVALGRSGNEMVEIWRDLHPEIAGYPTGEEMEGKKMRRGGLWKDLQFGCIEVVKSGIPGRFARCKAEMIGPDFWLWLPSGCPLIYPNARVERIVNSWGGESDSFTYDRAIGKSIVRTAQYGGKWVENIVQAVCTGAKGLLGASIVRCKEAGFEIDLHVHDEILTGVTGSADFEVFMHNMVELPSWAEGFCNKVAGFMGERYTKDPPPGATKFELLDDGYGNRKMTKKEPK